MKYEIRICRCGRIHFFPKDKLNNVTEHESFLLICSGCGESMIYGYVGYTGSEEKPIYRPHLANETLCISEGMQSQTNKFFEILIDAGIKVPMMSDHDATYYNPYSGFYDTSCYNMWLRSLHSDTKGDLTCDEKSIKERHTVDRKMFFERAMLYPGLLRQLAESRCAGFDWTGTPYDSEKQNVTDYFSRR